MLEESALNLARVRVDEASPGMVILELCVEAET